MKISDIVNESKLDEISRRNFLKGIGAAAGLSAVGKAGASGNDWESGRNTLANPPSKPALSKSEREEALRNAFRKDAQGATSVPVPQTGSYGERVRACVQPGVVFPVPPRKGSENPAVLLRVKLRPDGTVEDIKVTRSSGILNFDQAVATGIKRCKTFPKTPSGTYPGYIDINYNMYD
jgi:colicin import membrane protein